VGQRRTSFGGGAAAVPFGRESSSGCGASALQRIGVQPAAANATVHSPRTHSAHAMHSRGRLSTNAASVFRCVGRQAEPKETLAPACVSARKVTFGPVLIACVPWVYRMSTACSHAPTEWAGAWRSWRLWRGIGIGWRGG
jgi:hypothetical protein